MIKFWYDNSNHCMTISLELLFLGIFSSESHFLDVVFSIFETISHIVVDFVDLDIQYCCYFGLKADF